MHSAQAADPMNKYAKAMKRISGKRSKTEDDHAELARLEFIAGLYYDTDLGPVIPGENIIATLVEGGKRIKQGKNVTRSVIITDMVTPLVYTGPRTIDDLYGDGDTDFVLRNSVKVQQSRVMRTRPIFNDWQLEVDGMLDDTIIDQDVFEEIVTHAGNTSGLGDWRPRYGTFTYEIEWKK